MKKLDGKSLDIKEQNIEKLKELFPEVFSEGKIDFEKLENELGKFKTQEKERYNFTWNGKQNAKKIAQTPSTGTLRPCKADSKDWDTTQNLYIEGDNLEVLKLLQKSYHKQVKMIYIDPPYNTGKDFVYKDNFKDNIKNYLELTNQVDSDGNELSINSDVSGRYHSDWLSMMYERLLIARDLLREDGVIFISIDDNEVHNLRHLCDEVFGEGNFVGEIVRKTKSMTADKKTGFNLQHESLLVYARNLDNIFLKGEEKDYKDYKNPDNDPNGEWVSGDPTAKSGNESLRFKIINPYTGQVDLPPKGRYWAFSKETFTKYVEAGKIKFKKEKRAREIFDKLKVLKKHLRIVVFINTPETFNPYMLIWRVTNNIDALRDVWIEEIIGIDGTNKNKIDGFTREWPPDVDTTPEVIKKLKKLNLIEDISDEELKKYQIIRRKQ